MYWICNRVSLFAYMREYQAGIMVKPWAGRDPKIISQLLTWDWTMKLRSVRKSVTISIRGTYLPLAIPSRNLAVIPCIMLDSYRSVAIKVPVRPTPALQCTATRPFSGDHSLRTSLLPHEHGRAEVPRTESRAAPAWWTARRGLATR